MKKSSFCRKLCDRRRILYGIVREIRACWGEILLSDLFHFFEVNIFTLVFGEDLLLLPSGVSFSGTAAGVLPSCVLLFACIEIGSRLLVGTVGHVKAIREANSEERQDEIQNASESNAKEDNKSNHKGEKTSESGVHTVEVWGDGSKKEDAEKTFWRILQESSPICRVFGCFSSCEETPIGFCAQKDSDRSCCVGEMQQTCQRCGLARLFFQKVDCFRRAS